MVRYVDNDSLIKKRCNFKKDSLVTGWTTVYICMYVVDRWHQFRESVQEKNVKEFDFCSNPLPRLSTKMREVLSRKAFEKLATHQDLSNAIEKVFFRSEFLKKVVLFSKKLFHHPSFASLVYVKNRVSSSNIDLVFQTSFGKRQIVSLPMPFFLVLRWTTIISC